MSAAARRRACVRRHRGSVGISIDLTGERDVPGRVTGAAHIAARMLNAAYHFPSRRPPGAMHERRLAHAPFGTGRCINAAVRRNP